jgi:hypothetical protein
MEKGGGDLPLLGLFFWDNCFLDKNGTRKFSYLVIGLNENLIVKNHPYSTFK